jgi:hypothetical protein
MDLRPKAESQDVARELRKGDCVRVTRHNRMPHYEPGDKGMVAEGPNTLGGDRLYYLVMMDKDEPPRVVIFTEDEIERDG